MKKTLMLLAIALLGILETRAENSYQISAKVGVGASGWLGADVENMDSQFAYRLGVAVDFPITKMWGFQTGVNFEGLGASSDDSFYDSAELNVHQLYLEVPLMATTRFGVGKGLDIVCNAGPYLGVGVGGKTKGTLKGLGSESVDTFGDPDDGNFGLRRFDFGLGFGVGVCFQRFTVGLDTRFGLTSLAKDTSIHNYGVFMNVGYSF